MRIFRLSLIILLVVLVLFSFGITWKEAIVFLVLGCYFFMINKKRKDPLAPVLLFSVVLLIFKSSFELFNSNFNYPKLVLSLGRTLFSFSLGIIVIGEIVFSIFYRKKSSPFYKYIFSWVVVSIFILLSFISLSIGVFTKEAKFTYLIILSLTGCLAIVKSLEIENNSKFFVKFVSITFTSVALLAFLRLGLAISSYYSAMRYKNLGLLDKTVEDLKQAVFLNPIFNSAYLALSDAYSNLNDFDNSLSIFKRLSKSTGLGSKTYTKLGDLYFAQGEWEESARIFKYSLRLDRNLPGEFNFKLAYAYEKLGYLDRAAIEYAETLKKNKNMDEALERLVEIYSKKNLINNGSFEKWNKEGLPVDWIVDQSNARKLDINIEGNYCIEQICKVRCANLVSEVAVLPKVKYRFCVYSSVDAQSMGRIDIFGNKSGRLLNDLDFRFNNKEWENKEIIVETKDGDYKLIIFLQCLNPGDKILWDKAELRAVDINKNQLRRLILQ